LRVHSARDGLRQALKTEKIVVAAEGTWITTKKANLFSSEIRQGGGKIEKVKEQRGVERISAMVRGRQKLF